MLAFFITKPPCAIIITKKDICNGSMITKRLDLTFFTSGDSIALPQFCVSRSTHDFTYKRRVHTTVINVFSQLLDKGDLFIEQSLHEAL